MLGTLLAHTFLSGLENFRICSPPQHHGYVMGRIKYPQVYVEALRPANVNAVIFEKDSLWMQSGSREFIGMGSKPV